MSKFTTPLEVKVLDGGEYFELTKEFEYYRENNKNDVIKVPVGYRTDFASVPKIFWSILPPQGAGKDNDYAKAAVLHDYLYSMKRKQNEPMVSRKEADNIFLEAMKAVKVKKITRFILYWCVRLFGYRYYAGDKIGICYENENCQY